MFEIAFHEFSSVCEKEGRNIVGVTLLSGQTLESYFSFAKSNSELAVTFWTLEETDF